MVFNNNSLILKMVDMFFISGLIYDQITGRIRINQFNMRSVKKRIIYSIFTITI